MSLAKTKLPYSLAKNLADKITKELAPYCRRIEIAGSIRRQKAEIGDIEIVCIPRRQVNLFGDPGGSLLDPALEALASSGRIIKGDKWGTKMKKFHPAARPEVAVDLFIPFPEEWGYTFTIRTGCAEFSHKLVTPRQQGGYLPGHLTVSDCRLWQGGVALETPEEASFFEALGIPWIEPKDREEGTFEALINFSGKSSRQLFTFNRKL